MAQAGWRTSTRFGNASLGGFHALKILHAGSPGLAARLLQEGRIQARIRHRNVLVVTDVIDVDGRSGLVMEYLAGGTLSEWLEGGERTLTEKLAVFRGVVSGVAAAHREGLVHRDLKPSNVLLDLSENPPVPKVADFGIAKVLGEVGGVHTRTGMAIGTIAYMAPEQARNAKSADARCDVYALACIVYELVCGSHPFPGEDLWPVMSAKMESSYVPVRAVAPRVAEAVALAIEYGLVPEPDGRIQDCEMLTSVLDGRIGEGLLRGRLGELPMRAGRTLDYGVGRAGAATVSMVAAPPLVRGVTRPSAPPSRRGRFWLSLAVGAGVGLGALGSVAAFGSVARWWPETAKGRAVVRGPGSVDGTTNGTTNAAFDGMSARSGALLPVNHEGSDSSLEVPAVVPGGVAAPLNSAGFVVVPEVSEPLVPKRLNPRRLPSEDSESAAASAGAAPAADVSETIAAEAACDAEIIDMQPGTNKGRATPTIPPVLRRKVLHRAGWKCEVPDCRNRVWVDVHHSEPWVECRTHDFAKLIVVCGAHHRAIDNGFLSVSVRPDGCVAVEHADGRHSVGPAREFRRKAPSP